MIVEPSVCEAAEPLDRMTTPLKRETKRASSWKIKNARYVTILLCSLWTVLVIDPVAFAQQRIPTQPSKQLIQQPLMSTLRFWYPSCNFVQ